MNSFRRNDSTVSGHNAPAQSFTPTPARSPDAAQAANGARLVGVLRALDEARASMALNPNVTGDQIRAALAPLQASGSAGMARQAATDRSTYLAAFQARAAALWSRHKSGGEDVAAAQSEEVQGTASTTRQERMAALWQTHGRDAG